MATKPHEQMLERLSRFPPGYKFRPNDKELLDYLRDQINNQTLPDNKIMTVNLYEHSPQTLSVMYKEFMRIDRTEKKMYFFTPRDRKYPKGSRPNRAAKDGYWKATATEDVIKAKGNPIGYKRTLVYYQGNHKESTKTNWIMQETRVDKKSTSSSSTTAPHNMKLDDWVLCVVYLHEKQKDEESSDQMGVGSETYDKANPTHDMTAPVLNYNNCSASPMAAHQGNNCSGIPNQGNNWWDTPVAAHQGNNCSVTPNQGNNCTVTPNQGNNCWATPLAAHQGNNCSAIPNQGNNCWATAMAANQETNCGPPVAAHQDNNCNAIPNQGNNCWATPVAAHQGNNCSAILNQGNNCWATTVAAHQDNNCRAPTMAANHGTNCCPSLMVENQGKINAPPPLQTNYTHNNYFMEGEQLWLYDDGFDQYMVL